MTDEAFGVPHVLCSFIRREIDPVYVHGIGVPGRPGGSGSLSQQDVAVSPTPEFPESYHVSIKLSCFIQPLLPLPASLVLSFQEGGSGHHDGKLVGYSSLKGVYQDVVKVDSAPCLGQSKSGGILVKVTVGLVYAQGIDSLACTILDVFGDEGFLKGVAEFFECLFRIRDGQVDQFDVPSFSEGTSSSFAHCVKEDQYDSFVIFVNFIIHLKIGLHGQEPTHGIVILSREVFWKPCFNFSGFKHWGYFHAVVFSGFKGFFFVTGNFNGGIWDRLQGWFGEGGDSDGQGF